MQLAEVLLDIFSFLGRDALDTLEIVCRQYRYIVSERMEEVCLRQLTSASVSIHLEYCTAAIELPRSDICLYKKLSLDPGGRLVQECSQAECALFLSRHLRSCLIVQRLQIRYLCNGEEFTSLWLRTVPRLRVSGSLIIRLERLSSCIQKAVGYIGASIEEILQVCPGFCALLADCLTTLNPPPPETQALDNINS